MAERAAMFGRVLFGAALPVLLVLPSWWSVRSERLDLVQSRALVEAELQPLAEFEALAQQQDRLREALLERMAILDAVQQGREPPLIWLHALGSMPQGVVLDRAAFSGVTWTLDGTARSADDLEALRAQLTLSGLLPEQPEMLSDQGVGVRFTLAGRMPEPATGGGP